ncbi:MAG: NADH-quinone oxidoreductase subunit M [Gemmataceae bacterium]|nr:NADH-quinone oxidoreductase subunit M [Gemmataceae bacterium]
MNASALVIGLVALPFAAAIVVALLGAARAGLVRWVSLGAALGGLALAAVVTLQFTAIRGAQPPQKEAAATFAPELVPGADPKAPARTTWNIIEFGNRGAIQFYLGIDGMNIWLIVLTALLMVSAVLVSWNAIQERVNEYYAWLLALGAALSGVFLAFDIILFYVFFELTLVPLFFLIGIWGGPERRHAARKFFIFTFAGSVITLLGLLALVVVCHQKSPDRTLTFSIPELVRQVNHHLLLSAGADRAFWDATQFWVFFALFTGFAVKVPLFPVHTWLPLAHVEAPTAGSVLLAGVLLKLGSYGFLRLVLPLTPDACITYGVDVVGTLAVIGILYGALCALAQDDVKKLVAYSSISHLGFCMLGMFALNAPGLTGSLLQMINHGLSTGALFLIVGMLYERYHTRHMTDYGGIGAKLRILTLCMVVTCLSSAGLPGLNGFVGEALVLFGAFLKRPELAFIASAGILLGAWYLLSMLRQMFFGTLQEPAHEGHEVRDLDAREVCALAPLLVLFVILGVYPKPVIDTARPDLEIVAKILRNRPGMTGAPTVAQQGE